MRMKNTIFQTNTIHVPHTMRMCFALHACETIVLPGIAALRHYDYIARQEARDDAAIKVTEA